MAKSNRLRRIHFHYQTLPSQQPSPKQGHFRRSQFNGVSISTLNSNQLCIPTASIPSFFRSEISVERARFLFPFLFHFGSDFQRAWRKSLLVGRSEKNQQFAIYDSIVASQNVRSVQTNTRGDREATAIRTTLLKQFNNENEGYCALRPFSSVKIKNMMVLTIYQCPAPTGFQMAGKGSSDCTNASNPYHVCSEYCFEKKGESKKQIARKDSDYDGALKYSGNHKKTVRPDCTNGSNPYHNCNEFCSNRPTQSGRPKAERDSGSVGAKKGSRPKPPRELHVPLASAVSSKPQVTKPHVSPEEKKDVRSGENIKPYSEGSRFLEDALTIEEQNKFSQLILVSGNALKTNNLQKPRKTDAALHDEEEGSHATASPIIKSFLFPRIARNHEESDEEEVKSASSEPSVPVGKYYVKSSFASILQSIFNKHGDIAASCKLESFSVRSYYLECVCYIVQELQRSKFPQKMSKSKVRELLAILNDVESSEMNVGWLHSILNEVAEAVESGGQHWTLVAAKANCDHKFELTKKELESRMEDLTLKEKEMSDANAKVADTKARLSKLEFKYFQLDEAISSLQLKVNNIKCNALTDELL